MMTIFLNDAFCCFIVLYFKPKTKEILERKYKQNKSYSFLSFLVTLFSRFLITSLPFLTHFQSLVNHSSAFGKHTYHVLHNQKQHSKRSGHPNTNSLLRFDGIPSIATLVSEINSTSIANSHFLTMWFLARAADSLSFISDQFRCVHV